MVMHLFFTNSGPLHCAEVKEKEQNAVFPAEEHSTLTALKKLDAHQYGNVFEVEGEVQNISRVNLNGFLTVYLLGGSGDVISAQDVTITNGGKIFAPGETVTFSVMMDLPKNKKIMSVTVDFTKK